MVRQKRGGGNKIPNRESSAIYNLLRTSQALVACGSTNITISLLLVAWSAWLVTFGEPSLASSTFGIFSGTFNFIFGVVTIIGSLKHLREKLIFASLILGIIASLTSSVGAVLAASLSWWKFDEWCKFNCEFYKCPDHCANELLPMLIHLPIIGLAMAEGVVAAVAACIIGCSVCQFDKNDPMIERMIQPKNLPSSLVPNGVYHVETEVKQNEKVANWLSEANVENPTNVSPVSERL